MPLNESLENEDLTVHIPGGATEEISIHTDYAPPAPRLSWVDDDSRLVIETTEETNANNQQQTINPNQSQWVNELEDTLLRRVRWAESET